MHIAQAVPAVRSHLRRIPWFGKSGAAYDVKPEVVRNALLVNRPNVMRDANDMNR